MKKRFLAILLCLSVLLMACACAAETAVPPAASQPVSKEPAPQFTLSEVNAESSKTEEPAAPSENAPAESEPEETISIEESDVVIEPIQPIVPEEKETTLEKVLSFKTGENGLFTYGFVYAEDPANPTIGTPVNYCVDSKGNIYVAHADIICLNTGERFSYSSNYSILDMKVCGKSMFVLYMDGMVQEFDLSNGISKATIAETYLVNSFDPSSFAGDLFVIDENKPLLKIGSDELFSLNGTLLKGNERPFAMSKNVSDSAITKENGQPYIVYSKDEKKPNVLGCSSKGISTVINQNYVSTNFIKSESLYSWYDPKGNLQSEFLYGFETGKTVSCELSYPAGILSQYQGWNVRVDDVAFEDVLSSHIIVTSDETYYLILYYANYGVVYKIVAGYSGIKLSDLELLSHQTAEGAEAVVAVTSALPAPSSRDQVIREVSRIIQTPWTLLEEHVPETPPSNVTIPTYIKNTVVGTSMRGIPYCWGGFNSREEFMVLADSGLYPRKYQMHRGIQTRNDRVRLFRVCWPCNRCSHERWFKTQHFSFCIIWPCSELIE